MYERVTLSATEATETTESIHRNMFVDYINRGISFIGVGILSTNLLSRWEGNNQTY